MSPCHSITICLRRYSMHTATPEPALIFPPCNHSSINPSLLLFFFIIKLVLLQLLNYHCKNQFYNRVHTTLKTWPLTSGSDFSGEISRETIVVLNSSQSDRCVCLNCTGSKKAQFVTVRELPNTLLHFVTTCHLKRLHSQRADLTNPH